MKWQNLGSAPCYKRYRLAYRLSNEQGYSRVFISNITVNRWQPGSIELFTEEFFKEPKDLPPGEALVFVLYIFPVYGLYLTAPRLLFFEELCQASRASRWQGLWLFLGIAVLPLVSWRLG